MVDITPAGAPRDEGLRTKKPLQLMLPAISHERRQEICELHHRAATTISQAMREYWREGDRLVFEELSFLTFAEISASTETGSLSATFKLENLNVAGFVVANARLTKYFARAVIRAKTESLSESNQSPLSRLEAAIANKTMRALVGYLAAFYSDAGVGLLRGEALGEPAVSSARFAPDEFLLVLRLRLGAGEPAMRLSVAASVALLAAFPTAKIPTPLPPELPTIVRAVEVPLTASIVLGSWDLNIAELMNLRVGDEIVLPDCDDAWLLGGGIRLQRVRLGFAHNRVQASPKEGRANAS